MQGAIMRKRNAQGYAPSILMALAALIFIGAFAGGTGVAHADNFTDIFYTNSFRGAFTWIQKLDWVGMLVQIVISTFSLFGVALMTIRIMTSLLFLSAKGMWEEVHDLKSQGGESEKDLFGLVSMGKSWVQGKAGTGLDAIIGAVMLLLPDVKRYSDFGEKAGGDFSEDITVTQYILKIAIPTIMTVFFFAMGFNGTLFQALAVTVDFLGNLADKAISVNYTGIVDDLIAKNTGYKFLFDLAGTEEGKFQQNLAKDIYGRTYSKVRGLDAAGQEVLGQKVEEWVQETLTGAAKEAPRLSTNVKEGLASDPENYFQYVGYDVEINTSDQDFPGEIGHMSVTDLLGGSGVAGVGTKEQYVHVFVHQTNNYNGGYWATVGDSGTTGTPGGTGGTTPTGGGDSGFTPST